MRSLTQRLSLGACIGVAALAIGVIPVSADPAPAGFGFAPASTSSSTLPNVNITAKAGKPATWKPKALTVAPKTFTNCTKAYEVWTITNKTTADQTVKDGGSTLGTLAPKEVGGICSEGPSGTKTVFTITGSKSKFTLTLS
jgi:hypothetical protein